jgi:O-antigen/teichoic acid export membrane protein
LSTISLFSRLAKRDDAKFRIVLERTTTLLFLVSVPLAIGGAILANGIMSLVYGSAFASGGTAFALLMISIVPDFPGSLMANGLFVYERQKSLIITAIAGGVTNVGLDLLLIPRYGIIGSAIATLIAQIVGNGLVWYYMKQANYFEVIPRMKRIAVAGICMALVTVGLALLHANLILNIIISGLVYFGILKLLREPLLAEMLAIFPQGN